MNDSLTNSLLPPARPRRAVAPSAPWCRCRTASGRTSQDRSPSRGGNAGASNRERRTARGGSRRSPASTGCTGRSVLVDGRHDSEAGVSDPLLRARGRTARRSRRDRPSRRSCRRRPGRSRLRPSPCTSTLRSSAHAKDGTLLIVTAGARRPRPRPRRRPAGRRVQPDRRDRFGDLDHAGLDQDRCDADGAVPAHRQAPGHLDEEDAPVGVRPASAAAGSRRTSPSGRAART